MVKHTQTFRRQQPTNSLSVFDYFVGLALNRLRKCGNFGLIIGFSFQGMYFKKSFCVINQHEALGFDTEP